MSIEVKNISKNYGTFAAVKGIDLTIPTGSLVALLGPSGSGKTTLLRLIAGLEGPDSGSIYFNGEEFTDKPVKERKVGFVFQHYALFRHMTIFDNVAFGLKVQPRKLRLPKQEIKKRVMELLHLVQLEMMANRYPTQLSGGQRQRVALARALAVEPRVLLLDEPFGALDAKVRQELRKWLKELHHKLNITTVFVTHDQEEALEMADTVVVMNNGLIEQIGSPSEVYNSPANPFVYSFLGRVNLFKGRSLEGKLQVAEKIVEIPAHVDVNKMEAVGYIRPHDIKISKQSSAQASTPAIVCNMYKAGPTVRLDLRQFHSQEVFEVELGRKQFEAFDSIEIGETVFVDLENMTVFVQEASSKTKFFKGSTLPAIQ